MTSAGPLRRDDVRVVARLSREPLDPSQAIRDVQDPVCGGIGLFTGVVRNHHQGDAVRSLEYEAWEREVEPALRQVADAVCGDHPGVRAVHLSHRVGHLQIGDLAVVVAASAPHRAEAIAATRDLIDRLKETVPVWKKEHLVDGTSRWVRCDHAETGALADGAPQDVPARPIGHGSAPDDLGTVGPSL